MNRVTHLVGAAVLVAVPAAVQAQQAPSRHEQPAQQQAELPLKHAPQPTVPAITANDLMTRLYIFADDSMMGRRAGTEGNLKGTAYIAREVEKLGLVPAGDEGTYFQNVPLVRRSIAETTDLGVDGAKLALFEDYVPVPVRGSARSLAGAQVVYGGTVENPGVTAEQATGKLVLLTAPEAARRRMRVAGGSALEGAAGIAIVTEISPQLVNYVRSPSITMKETDAREVPAVLEVTPHAAELLLGAPLDSAAVGTAGKTVSGEIRYQEEPAPARNVVAVLPGSDPALKGEYVAIGAHNDHIGIREPAVEHDSLRAFNTVMRKEGADSRAGEPTAEQWARILQLRDSLRKVEPARLDSINNGADDDGSGSVTALEIAQAFAQGKDKPKRSLLFVWHTGEELGMLGSGYFVEHPTVPRDSIVAQLNMDMVGRGAASDETGRNIAGEALHGGPNYLQLVGSRRLSTELGDIVESVNKSEPHPFTFDYSDDANGHPQNIYCRSDHWSYARFGIPVTFFTTGLHRDYHQVTDEPQYIDYDHMARVADLVHDIALHVADMDHRPVVDHPKPDPNGPCRQ